MSKAVILSSVNSSNIHGCVLRSFLFSGAAYERNVAQSAEYFTKTREEPRVCNCCGILQSAYDINRGTKHIEGIRPFDITKIINNVDENPLFLQVQCYLMPGYTVRIS